MSFLAIAYNIFSIIFLGDYVPLEGSPGETASVYDVAYEIAYSVTGTIDRV